LAGKQGECLSHPFHPLNALSIGGGVLAISMSRKSTEWQDADHKGEREREKQSGKISPDGPRLQEFIEPGYALYNIYRRPYPQ
jgi:hypothetical protein